MGRRLRMTGEILRLGGVDYRLEGVEGCGGSAVVYRASYEDHLNKGCFHQVLIKELFPFHGGDAISRGEDGRICCSPEGEALMECSRRSFLAGNQANLRLLQQLPEQISGNLNSYEAYGTYYSVLTVHGGISLQILLEEEHAFTRLREAAQAVIWILEALKCFHQEGILHLDISPDNILMLKKQALLIDYNSTWQMHGSKPEDFLFSEKEGYTAPEIRLRRIAGIGPASDLFSVCAVFFRMLAGRRLTDEDLTGRGPGHCFSEDLPIFQGEPLPAVWKAAQIVTRGLHLLPRKRYQSADALLEEFQELIRRIDGRGISHNAVWESSYRSIRKFRCGEEHYLERSMKLDQGTYEDDACFRLLAGGRRILLTGEGGLGKTSFLTEMSCRNMKRYSPRSPVVLYIPLADYQEAGGENGYIRKCILRKLCFSQETEDMEMAMHELEQLLDAAGGQTGGYILLLDGLNEAGEKQQRLLQEIEGLGKRPGISILVTDRSDSVKRYGLRGFDTACLLPLKKEQVLAKLAEDEVRLPEDGKLMELLVNPMMLSLYRQTVKMAAGQGEDGIGGAAPHNMEDMVHCYLENLHTCQLRRDSGNLEEQLRHSYVLTHLLPAVAWEMKCRRKVVLTLPELYELSGRNYRRLLKKQFAMAFPEYAGKSRLMLKGIANEGEWFDYAIREHLMERLNLLTQSGSGNFRLCHENFLEYLAAENKRNRKIYRSAAGKVYGLRLEIGLLAAVLLASGGAIVWHACMPKGLTEAEMRSVRNAAQRLLVNLQLLDVQLMNQENLLKEASASEVLEGDPVESEKLRENIERILEKQQQYQMTASDGARLIGELEDIGREIPLDTLQRLYLRTFDMNEIMEESLGHLEACLCDPDSVYEDRAKREPVVVAYQQYLEAYGAVVYLELTQVLSYVKAAAGEDTKEDTVDLVLDGVAEMSVLKRYMAEYPLSGITEEELGWQLAAAESQLEDARGELRKQNFPMEASAWQ